MDKNKLLQDSAIDICIQKIALEINEKMEKYEKTKENAIKLELIQLMRDRELVYRNDKKTIGKYLENGENNGTRN